MTKKILRTLLPFWFAGILLADPIAATFTGVNGADAFGYYVGPYYGTLDTQTVTLYCVDFANDVNFGQSWAANLSHIDTQSDLGNTRFGARPNALALYQQAAWLTQQYALNPSSAYADIQTTIWQLFDPLAPSPSSSYWLNQAQANYMNGNYADIAVVTNVGPVLQTGQVQEFLTVIPNGPLTSQFQGGASAVPEPRWTGAVGLALLAVAWGIRRRSNWSAGSPQSTRDPNSEVP